MTGGGSGAIQIWSASAPAGSTIEYLLDHASTSTPPTTTCNSRPTTRELSAPEWGSGGVWKASDGSPVFRPQRTSSEDMNDAAYSPDGSRNRGHRRGWPAAVLRREREPPAVVRGPHGELHQPGRLGRQRPRRQRRLGGQHQVLDARRHNQFVASGSWSLGSQAFGIAVSPDHKTLAVGGDGGFMFISYAPRPPAVVRYLP